MGGGEGQMRCFNSCCWLWESVYFFRPAAGLCDRVCVPARPACVDCRGGQKRAARVAAAGCGFIRWRQQRQTDVQPSGVCGTVQCCSGLWCGWGGLRSWCSVGISRWLACLRARRDFQCPPDSQARLRAELWERQKACRTFPL
jgi:hypothetical protein